MFQFINVGVRRFLEFLIAVRQELERMREVNLGVFVGALVERDRALGVSANGLFKGIELDRTGDDFTVSRCHIHDQR